MLVLMPMLMLTSMLMQLLAVPQMLQVGCCFLLQQLGAVGWVVPRWHHGSLAAASNAPLD